MLRVWWRNELRNGWRSMLLLLVMVGLGGGVALTALAGARRADTAMPRFQAYSQPATGAVFFGDSFGQPPPVTGSAATSMDPPPYTTGVLSLPQVASYGRVIYLFTTTNAGSAGAVNTFGLADPAITRQIDRPVVLSGRLPDPNVSLEAAVNELAASKLHLRVGSFIQVRSFNSAQLDRGLTGSGGPGAPSGPSYAIRVTGIVRFVPDVNAIVPLAARQDVTYEGQQNAFLTPAFVDRLAHDLGISVQHLSGMNAFGVRLKHGGRDWESFVAAAKARAARNGIPVNFQQGDPLGSEAAARSAQRGIHVEAVALALFGGLAAIVTLLLVGQAVSRQLRAAARDRATLRSLGASRLQLTGAGLVCPAVVAFGGAALACLIAWLGSPLMPVGLGGKAEIHPGFQLNAVIVLGGGAALAVLLLVRAAWPAW